MHAYQPTARKGRERTVKTAIGTIAAIAVAALVCAGGWILLQQDTVSTDSSTTTATGVVDKMKTTASYAKVNATNAALDASGVKTKLQNALESSAATIAAKTGLSETQVDGAIADLNIESWQAAVLPSSAVVKSTYATSYQGTDATVTTYEDPTYVTVSSMGQEITLSVPESAQNGLNYLAYLS